MPTAPNYNIKWDFKYISELTTSFDKSKSEYAEGLNKLESIVDHMSKKAEELNLNVEDLKKSAETLKQKCGGDILPVLRDLSKFTGFMDPQDSLYEHTKPEYLATMLCWASIAKDYIELNSKLAEDIRSGKTY